MVKYYYAVKIGKKRGIYENWSECSENVLMYPGAVYKKFGSLSDAKDFLNDKTEPRSKIVQSKRLQCGLLTKDLSLISSKKTSSQNVHLTKQTTNNCQNDVPIVYCDGSCFRNGTTGARAGVGVYWGLSHPQNVSERLRGKQTNQRAELVAACKALEGALKCGLESVQVRTDSKYTINVVTKWINKWRENRWKTATGDDVKNKEDIVKLDSLNSKLRVSWVHVPGHAGVSGNEEADKLAKCGSNKELIY